MFLLLFFFFRCSFYCSSCSSSYFLFFLFLSICSYFSYVLFSHSPFLLCWFYWFFFFLFFLFFIFFSFHLKLYFSKIQLFSSSFFLLKSPNEKKNPLIVFENPPPKTPDSLPPKTNRFHYVSAVLSSLVIIVARRLFNKFSIDSKDIVEELIERFSSEPFFSFPPFLAGFVLATKLNIIILHLKNITSLSIFTCIYLYIYLY